MRYNLQARLFPTLIASSPIWVLAKIILGSFESYIKEFTFLPATAQLFLYLALLFLFVQMNRIVSVEIFQKYLFKGELYICPVSRLLWVDTQMDKTKKYKIRRKIKEMFGITLMNRSEELINEIEARELISYVISKIQFNHRGDNILLQHKIEYAFARNLIGGAGVAVIISCALLVIGYYFNVGWIVRSSIIMGLIYLLPVLFAKFIIKWYGSRYTKVLFEKYLSL
jgi:hypothetical protein